MKAHFSKWQQALTEEAQRHPYAFVWIPLLAALVALGWTGAMSFMTLQIVPMARLVWWWYPLLGSAVFVGALSPLLRDAFEIGLGKVVTGGILFVIPSVVEALLSLFRDGWSIDALIIDGLLPGFFLCAGYAFATMLGDGCAILFPERTLEGQAEIEGIEQRGRYAQQHLSRLMFKAWILLALFGTLLAEGIIGPPQSAPPLSALLFATIGLIASLLALSAIHLLNMRRRWEAEEDDPITQLGKPRRQDTLWLLLSVLGVATVLPANVSPIARRGVGGFFEQLNELLAPLFVRTGRAPERSGGKGFAERLRDLLLPNGAGDSNGNWTGGLQTAVDIVMAVVIVGATAFAIHRLYTLLRRRDKEKVERPQYEDRGIIVEFLLWLWERVRGLFRQVSAWFNQLVPTREPGTEKVAEKVNRIDEEGEEYAAGTLARIQRLFVRMLRQLGQAGYPRAVDETPYEYAERVSAVRPDAEDELATVTNIYVEARYSSNKESSFLERAYQSLRSSVRQVLRAIRRKSADRR